jgi:hypothetical protein
MAREHEAGRSSFLEILRFTRRERDSIVRKMEEQKSRHLLERDRAVIVALLDDVEADFEAAWSERKRALTKHAKFCIYSAAVRAICAEIVQMRETVRAKTNVGETSSSAESAIAFLNDSFPALYGKLHERMEQCQREGCALEEEISAHQATIRLGNAQMKEKMSQLHEFVIAEAEKLKLAAEFFKLLDDTESFIRDANRALIEWSRKISTITNEKDARAMRSTIEAFVKSGRSRQGDVLLRLSSLSGALFGESANQRLQMVQAELNDTFGALETLLQQIDGYMSHTKSINEEEQRKKRIQVVD